MTDVELVSKERTALFYDVYDNKIPNRIPINISLHTNVIAGYAGIHGADALWDPGLLTGAAMDLADQVPTDVCIFGGSILNPAPYQALGSNSMKIGTTGLMQHPNHVGLFPEDYDQFIANAYDCIIETVLPRNYNGLNFKGDPARAMFTIAQGIDARTKNAAKSKAVADKIRAKYGAYALKPGQRQGVYAPLDILTDSLRSLSGMAIDIRRMPDKVEEAVESVYPLNYKCGLLKKPDAYSHVFWPLHIATYMKVKDFERLFWKSFCRQVTDYASLGMHSNVFCEHNWMHLLDYVQELPTNTVLQFEQCDPKLIKEKLGKKFIITGSFPLSTLRTCTRDECIAKTREWLDIMMPGGKYIFGFDKNPLTIQDVNIENLRAVCETVLKYGEYDNAGEKAGLDYCQEDYRHSEKVEFKSKYYRTWEEYLAMNPLTPEFAKDVVMDTEDMIVKYIYGLCQ